MVCLIWKEGAPWGPWDSDDPKGFPMSQKASRKTAVSRQSAINHVSKTQNHHLRPADLLGARQDGDPIQQLPAGSEGYLKH